MTKNVERGNSTARAGRLIRGGVLMGLVGLMALLVAACGGEDPTATPVPPQPTAPLDAAALFQVEWDTLLAAAQEEGEVVTFIAGSLGRSNLKDLLPRFEEKYGIAVIFSTGSSRQNADNRIVIHTIGLGLTKSSAIVFMQGLAAQNGGQFAAFR